MNKPIKVYDSLGPLSMAVAWRAANRVDENGIGWHKLALEGRYYQITVQKHQIVVHVGELV